MSNVNVAGRMSRRTMTKDLNGNIINLLDENNGGWIIRNRQVVNPQRWEEIQRVQQDKIEASKAQTMQKVDANAPDRTVSPSKTSELEKRVDGMESKLDAILKALNK